MNEMNPDESLPQGTTVDASAGAEPPKRRRASRKTAVETVSAEAPATPADLTPVVADEALAKPKRTRKPKATAQAAEEGAVMAAEAVPPAVVEAVAPVVAAEATEVLPPKRPARSRKKPVEPVAAEVVATAEVEPTPAEPVSVTVAAAPVLSPVGEAGDAASGEVGSTVSEDDSEATAGSNGRRRNRGRRGRGGSSRLEGAAQQAAAVAAEPLEPPAPVETPLFTLGDVEEEGPSATSEPVQVVDAGALFTEVLSGAYDQSAEGDVSEELGKRVLRPEPEAPKLHKVLAQSGIGSRRDMEDLIEQGQVTVNGEVAHVGMRVARGDQVKIAGRPVKIRIAPPPARVVAYHKPVGEVVTHHDPEGRPTVFRNLPRLPNGKWLSVGRLDINTEGLLLFTNSGDLANQLMHPRFGVEREYAARVLGTLDEAARAKLLSGVEIDGQSAAFKSIEDGGGEGANHWYRVVINEGRNREVRKLFESVGMAVSRLIRIRYGTVVLPRGLKRGVWVELDEDDVRAIRRLAAPEAGPRQGQGQGQPQIDKGRGRGAQHGGAMLKGGAPGPQGQVGRGPQAGQGGKQRGKAGPGGFERRDERRDDRREDRREPRPADYDDDIPQRIPNPLEQTFDRRFATGSKRITSGFGRPMEEDRAPQGGRGQKGGGPKQPDPMQTSVGYIGADAYFSRPGQGGKNRGGRRR